MLLVDIEYLVKDAKAVLNLFELVYRWDGEIKDPSEWLHFAFIRKTQWYLCLAPRMLLDGTFETRKQARQRADSEFTEIGLFDHLTDEEFTSWAREYHADGRKRVALDNYDYWDALRTETERLFEETKWGGTGDKEERDGGNHHDGMQELR